LNEICTDTDKFGLEPNTISTINQVFSGYSKILRVIVYGSRSLGTFSRGSDIDLTIIAPDMTTSELFAVEERLDDLLLPYKIDLSLFHQIENPDLVKHIKAHGKIFYLAT
jgi:predicted nucleotidyltransferase